MELIVVQPGYTQDRPHIEEFYLPKQCEAYNLFQQINIVRNRDENGELISQQAQFKHIFTDAYLLLKKEFDIDFSYTENNTENTGGITGTLSHNETEKAKDVEVLLLNEEDQILRITETNQNGDFTFEKLDSAGTYKVLVNQEDAIASYNESKDAHPSEFYIEGILFDYTIQDNIPRPETTIFLAKEDKILNDMTITDEKGTFKFTNTTTPIAEVEQMKDKTTITYNLDQSNPEILYSALLTTVDPDDETITFTEHVDIVELQRLSENDPQLSEYADLLFDFDKFFLRQKSEDILETLYQFMKENQSVQVKLDGHTDWFGTEQYNEKLSKSRALSAHKYLIEKGISPDRIENAWFGEASPKVSNTNIDGTDSEANRQLNRRVEIKVEIPEMADLYLSL